VQRPLSSYEHAVALAEMLHTAIKPSSTPDVALSVALELPYFDAGQSKPGTILDSYPEYRTTSRLDELRATEYSYLDKQDHVYLDYTGSGLAADAQRRAHEERLANTLCGNPHSVNPTSEVATHLVEKARARVLAHLNASPDEYTVIFTPNATGAAKLIGEAYPFSRAKPLQCHDFFFLASRIPQELFYTTGNFLNYRLYETLEQINRSLTIAR
jgi:hypothetical protein